MLTLKRPPLVAVILAAVLGGVGFLVAGLPTAGAAGSAATLSVRSTKLGPILVNAHGHTLYLFVHDRTAKSTCTGVCAKSWRPLTVQGTPSAGTGAKAALLGTSARADRTRQVTYHHHPLYAFARDTAPGQTNGEGVSAFGGKWYAVSAAGNAVLHPVTTTVPTTSVGTTTTTATTTTPTTTAAPGPRPIAGRYCGFTGNGSGICFDVTPGGLFWANGHFGVVSAACSPGPTYFDITFDTQGQTPIAADLTFNFTSQSGDAAGTAVTGTFDTAGNAQGHLHVTDAFDYNGTRYTCGLDADWQAKLQQ